MRVGLLLAGIAAASAFSVLPACRSVTHRSITPLQMQESNAELQPKNKAAAKKTKRMSLDATSGASVAMDNLEKLQEMEEMEERASSSLGVTNAKWYTKRLGTTTKGRSGRLGTMEWSFPSGKEKSVKFPMNLFGSTFTDNSEKDNEARGSFSRDPEVLAQAKKSAIFLVVAIFLVQPLSYAGYYGPETNPNNWWEYGQLVKSPSLCTASAQTCANRESNARSRAEQDQVDNALWQARSKSGNVGLANQFEEERGASTWWGKQSIYKDGSARDQDRINFETKERQRAEEVQAIANAKKAAEIAKNAAADAEAKKVIETAEAKRAAADIEAKKLTDAQAAKKVAADIDAKKITDAQAAKKVAADIEAKKITDAQAAKKAAEAAKKAAAATAASAPANGLPGGWSEAKDPTSGKKYYYNAQNAVQWDIPTAPAKAVAKAAPPAAAPTAPAAAPTK